MINLSKNQWHVRWFLLMHSLWNRDFKDRGGYYWFYELPRTTNICHYIRGIVLYPLFLLLLVGLPYASLVYVLLVKPIATLGFVSFLDTLIAIGVFLFWTAIIGVAIGLIGYTLTYVKERIQTANENRGDEHPSFIKVFKQYIKDRHDRFCTMISLEKDDNNV